MYNIGLVGLMSGHSPVTQPTIARFGVEAVETISYWTLKIMPCLLDHQGVQRRIPPQWYSSVTEIENATYWLGWIHVAKVTGAFLVAIGVAAEFLGDFVARPYEDRIEAARRAELAELHRQSDEAKLKTAALSSQAESYRAAIADASARAAEAQLALETFRDSRKLDSAQQERIKAAIGHFSGMPFDMTVTLEPEPQSFATQIGTMLESAGWIWKDRNNTLGHAITLGKHQAGLLNGGPALGIEIDVSRQREWEPALLRLGDAFKAEGFAPAVNVANDNSASPDAIHIYVGNKK